MKQLNVKQKIFCSIILGLFCSMVSLAQGAYEITGKVTSDDGMALPGVNVLVVGTPNGTATDFDGNYKITASSGESLEFNYIGFATQTIALTGQKTINVTLAQDAESLADVVVIGYGTRKKSDITGSVSSVKAEELTAFPVLNAEQALQGRAAGVVVQSNNGGEPGAPISIQIRGNTSINASSKPLIVVDGFVNATMPQANDIQSIEVLKDASSTAIYGSQGANGVIMVTTKKGRTGKMTVEVNSNYSVQTTANELDLLNATDFTAYQNAVRENVAITNSTTAVPYVQGVYDTDWQDLIYTTGNTANHQLSFSGGTENVNYYASGSYFKQDGVLVNSGFERISFLSNIDLKLSDKLKMGLNMVANFGKKNGVATQSDGSVTVGGDDAVSLAMRFAPDKGILDENGEFSTNNLIGDEVDNPYAVATQRDDDTNIENFRANLYLDYEILKGLNFKTTFGLSSDNQTRGRYSPRTLPVTAGRGLDGRAIIDEDRDRSMLTESYLTYNTSIGKGDLTVLGGFSYQKTVDTGFYSEGTGTISDLYSYYGLSSATSLINGTVSDIYQDTREIQSFFGRINYDYDDRYLLTATLRRDGSSSFAENEKYATFPSAAIGWRVSNEKFLENADFLSNLKLRASYGITGNQAISPYESLANLKSIYASFDGSSVLALSPDRAANPDLKWETSTQQNYGIDIGLFKNKISLSFDYYNIDTEDLIMTNQDIPDYIGLLDSNILVNAGETNNEGFDITLNTRNITTDDFSWSTDFIFSKNKNTVESLIGGIDFLLDGAPSYFSVDNNVLLREGEEAGLFYGLDYVGVYQGGAIAPGTATLPNAVAGDPLFRDVADENGAFDGAITNDDRTIIGNPNPDFTWGITNNFRYKNIDLNIFFQGSQGGDIFNMTNVQLNNGDANTTYDYFNNAWTPTNTNTNQPRVGNNSSREISSRFVEDGSYVRLKNIAIGYTIESKVLENLKIESLRISASAQNLLTFTDYSGLDPEVNYFSDNATSNTTQNNVRGFDFGNYPTVKSFTFGVNVKF